MKRAAVVALLISVAGLVGLVGWQALSREAEYRRLIAEGDRALKADQTFPAVEAFSGAIALRPDSMLAYLKRGETYHRRGDTGAALRDLRAAARLDPTAPRPLELLGDVNASIERYARAIESYEEYLRLDDRSPHILYKLALARYRMGSVQGALPPLMQAVAIDDRFAEGHYLLGLCQRALGRLGDAVGSLERAVRLAPKLLVAREELADLYAATRDDAAALEQLEALARLEPNRLQRRLAVAVGYARAGRQDVAVVSLRNLAREHTDAPEVYVAIGRVWLEAAEASRDRVALNKALEALETLARRGTTDSEALMLLGRAQFLTGDVAGAERSLRQSTARLPVEPAALLQLSLVAERAGHLGTARDALARYVALSGDGIPSLGHAVHLGDLSSRLNEPAAAAEWYARAAEHQAATPPVFVSLAEARLRLRDPAGALDAVERGLSRSPDHARLASMQRRLRDALGPR